MKHLLSISDLDRTEIEDLLDLADQFGEVLGSRHPQGPDPARGHGGNAVLRGIDQDQAVVRTGGQGAFRRRDDICPRNLLGDQG